MATKTVNENIYKQIAGLDIGNGCVKGMIRSNAGGDTEIDIASVAAKSNGNLLGDIRIPLSEVKDRIDNIFNDMDATFESPCLDDTARYLLGNRAIHSGNHQILFDISDGQMKSHQELSAILTLGSIAGKALQDAWKSMNTLPNEIHVDVRVAAFALPIHEYRTCREIYANSYKKASHRVTIHTFETDVAVFITFTNVQVLAEGAAATFAIRAGGKDMADKLIACANEATDQHISVTGENICMAYATMGIDIGEGTTNLPVYDFKGNFNTDASTSLNNGYGLVLDRAVTMLKQKGHSVRTRKDLQDYLMNPSATILQPNLYGDIQTIVDGNIENFAEDILDIYKTHLRNHNTQIMVVYVYGGGAAAMKYFLFDKLVKKTRALNGGNDAQPILYFDNPEARLLNRDGLFLAAMRILEIMGETI